MLVSRRSHFSTRAVSLPAFPTPMSTYNLLRWLLALPLPSPPSFLPPLAAASLRVRLYDYDNMISSDALGEVVLPLGQMLSDTTRHPVIHMATLERAGCSARNGCATLRFAEAGETHGGNAASTPSRQNALARSSSPWCTRQPLETNLLVFCGLLGWIFSWTRSSCWHCLCL